MGIPAFYRWLVATHPLAVADVLEDSPSSAVNGAVNSTRPNPYGVEFDNLYLDMNGIIHPCFHSEHFPAPTSYEEVFKAIFKYIDKIFSMIRPRKLLYLAIDGVAPRAKMNHQRARRFRAAKEASDEALCEDCVKKDKRAKVTKLTPSEQNNKLDSNVITPGTKFMSLLSSALQYYVHLKINGDPEWKNIKVIVSDASVPGEGEHKIMSYIRLQRNLPGFDPNARHCLYGLDADLIMLALASHEIHFSILREDVSKPPEGNRSKKDASNSRGKGERRGQKSCARNMEDYILNQKFQFFHVWILRDYLAHELRIPVSTVELDLERLIDDFVFMCMFVGNDFLPHMPSLQIFEGAIDLMMNVYKKEFIRMGGYLTDSWKVNLEPMQHFVQAVGSYENAIFQKRGHVEKQMNMQSSSSHFTSEKTKSSTNNSNFDVTSVIDQIKLEEPGWKERYYFQKFEAKTDDERERIRKDTVLKYVEGICWVMHYYYEGVCSWQWFYPYHYAPFASDFHDLDKLQIKFTLGTPFKPFDQLMGVLPAASAHALPLAYGNLMTDPSSPILDFYPSDFEVDLNGKRFSWQGICKLPFIEESRLLSELAKVEHTLTDEEKQRNSSGLDMLFVHKIHPLAGKILSFYMKSKDHPKLHEAKVKQKINPEASAGMNGYMYVSDKLVSPPEIDSPFDDMPKITQNEVIYVFYKYPTFHSHIPRPPEGVIMPAKSVSKKNVFSAAVLWHEKSSIRVTRDRRTTKFVSSRRLAISAHRLVSMLQTQRITRMTDCESLNSMEGGQSNEACAKITVSEKEVNGEGKECGAIASRKRKRNICLDDVAPASKQTPTALVNGEFNGGNMSFLAELAFVLDQMPRASAKEAYIVANEEEKLFRVADVAYVPNQLPTFSLKEVNGEANGENEKFGVAEVASVLNQKPTFPVEEVRGEANGEGTLSGVADMASMPESVVAVSKKRKRRLGQAKKANADVASMSNQMPAASVSRETTLEGNVSVVADVASIPNQTPTASVKGEANGEGDLYGVADMANQKPKTASVKEVNGEENEEGKVSGVLNVASIPNQKATASVKEGNASGVADVASVPNQMPAAASVKEVNREVDGDGEPYGFSQGKVSFVADVALVPSQRPTSSVKEAYGEGNFSLVADVASVPNQKPSKEMNGEGNETDVIGSKKRKQRRVQADKASAGVADVAPKQNQEPNNF